MNSMRSMKTVCLAAILLAMTAVPACAAEPAARPLMKDFMGINGHTILFKPELYKSTCRLVRDYHNVSWDIPNTSAATQFPMTINEVNGAQRSWKDEVYGPWRQHGWDIDVSLQFSGIEQDDWKDLPRDAYAYGKSFAEYFGPSGENKLADWAEIGNEPGFYDDATYRAIFENMARGLRAGDPKLKIVTCAVLPGESHRYAKSLECVRGLEELYDVINIHTYAMKPDSYDRHRSYPEDPEIKYLVKPRETLAWRDAHAPGKPVWITEFGWEAAAQAAPETGRWRKWLDVTDEQQAQYIVRSFMIFSAMDFDRAYLYFYNDTDEPWQHAASGITRNYQPKPSFHAMAHLYRTLGEYRFARIVTEKVGELYVYEYVNGADDRDRVWAVWSPTDTRLRTDTQIAVPVQPTKAERMPITEHEPEPIPCQRDADGRITLAVDGSPVYVWMRLDEK